MYSNIYISTPSPIYIYVYVDIHRYEPLASRPLDLKHYRLFFFTDTYSYRVLGLEVGDYLSGYIHVERGHIHAIICTYTYLGLYIRFIGFRAYVKTCRILYVETM